jgi:hypothetical protein
MADLQPTACFRRPVELTFTVAFKKSSVGRAIPSAAT